MTHHTSSGADIPADVTWCAEPERPRSPLGLAGAPNANSAESSGRLSFGRAVTSGAVAAGAPPLPLTPRQAEVLLLSAEGFGVREIGHALGIAARTVKDHTEAIRRKLGAASITHAVWLARRQLEAGT